jgi:hypothetical protein
VLRSTASSLTTTIQATGFNQTNGRMGIVSILGTSNADGTGVVPPTNFTERADFFGSGGTVNTIGASDRLDGSYAAENLTWSDLNNGVESRQMVFELLN